MPQIVRDILDDPREYMPFLILLAGVLGVWVALSVLGICSARAKTRRWKFWLAMGPVLFGAVGVCGNMPFSIQSGNFQVHLQLNWLFLLPLLVGIYGLVLWFRMRRAEGAKDYRNTEHSTSNAER